MENFHILYWYWWCLALVLAALEMFLPGAAFLWIAGAAALTGLLALVLEPAPAWQVALFGGLAAAAWYLSRRFSAHEPADALSGTLNRRGEQYLGQVVALEEAIINGKGRARIGDGMWSVCAAADMPAGTIVRVIGVDGAILRVESAQGSGVA